MAFVNVSLLVGGLLTAIPVLLHLVMRQQPQRLVFPALQFLRQRREVNRRKLQLRHWLLLALRCAAIILLAVAFARPSVLSSSMGRWMAISLVGGALVTVGGLEIAALVQRKGRVLITALGVLSMALLTALMLLVVGAGTKGAGLLLGDEEAPVAAALIFDTSPRMEYRHQNQTRLEAAQEVAAWLIKQLPPESEVAVLDARPAPAVLAVDLAAARKAIERLRMTEAGEPLPSVARRAVELLSSNSKSRREAYVFTDLSAESWRDDAHALKETLREHPDLLLYVIDVGVSSPRNAGLGRIELSAETLAESNELRVTAEVRSHDAPGPQVVRILLEQFDPTLPLLVDGQTRLPSAQARGQQEVTLDEHDAQRVEFRLRGLEPGMHQGFIQLAGSDGLALDNTRYFAVEVTEAWPILVVAPEGTEPELFTEAIAPFEFQQTGQARFSCTTVAPSQLASRELDRAAVVCLLDPEPIPASVWEQLGRYVRRGGSLFISLGHNAQATSSFQEPAAQELLAGRLTRVWRSTDREVYLVPERFGHPVLAPFRDRPTSVPWDAAPVFRHWDLELADDAGVIVSYANGRAALIERAVGRGRVVTMTTPVSDPLRPPGRQPWNELPTSEQAWPYVVLMNELLLHLTDRAGTRLNYVVGETAVLPNDPDEYPERYQLFTPLEQPQEARAHEGELVIRFTEHAGAYRLKGVRDGPVLRGFAANLPAEATDLRRLTLDDLSDRLGKGRYQYARNQDEIELEVGEARVGREFYSHLIVLLAVILGVEHLMSNRFYRKTE